MEHDSYEVHLYLGDGRGGFARSPNPRLVAHAGSRPHTHACIAADVDADGDADLLTTNAADDAISVLLNDGRARFAPAPGSPFAAPRHPYSSLAVIDLDGGGNLDVAAPLLQSGEIGVYLGDGTGRFANAPGSPYAVFARPGFVHAADLDGDGKPELLATHDDVGMVDVLRNRGGGRFEPASGSPVRLPQQVWYLVTADFDGDADCDVISTAYPGRSLVLLLGDSPGRLATGDLDGDGHHDVVSTNHDSGDVTVLLRRH
jgi:hypothetical protein